MPQGKQSAAAVNREVFGLLAFEKSALERPALPDCRVVDNFATQSINGVDYVSGQLVMNCLDNGGAVPCWTTVDEPQHCPQGGHVLQIDRGMNREPRVVTAFTCAACPTDRAELGCLQSPHKMPDAGAFP